MATAVGRSAEARGATAAAMSGRATDTVPSPAQIMARPIQRPKGGKPRTAAA
ncbi:hypothetical protein JCM10369A_19390 [Nocardioides pyridinolyticus]